MMFLHILCETSTFKPLALDLINTIVRKEVFPVNVIFARELIGTVDTSDIAIEAFVHEPLITLALCALDLLSPSHLWYLL
jgi:hypothetical protein